MKTPMQKTVVGRKAKTKLSWSLALTGLLLLLPGGWAQQFAWPVYEPFSEYTVTPLNLGAGATSNYWNFGNGSSGVASYVVSNTAAMSYPALLPDPNVVQSGVQAVPVITTSADRGMNFTAHSNVVYASFLLNYIDNGASVTTPGDRLIFNLVYGAPTTNFNGGSFTKYYATVWLTADYRIKINKNYSGVGAAGFSTTSAVLSTNVTHLIVVRYQTNSVYANPAKFELWIDPTPFGYNNQIPPSTLSTTNGANFTAAQPINGLVLNDRQLPTYTGPNFWIDEIRIDNNWAGVTPLATAAPGSMYTLTGGGSTCAGSSVDIALSGSDTTCTYLLYTNAVYTSVSLRGTGSALDFGLQSVPGFYSVLASNTTTAAIGWMSNTVPVTIIQPPVIGAQPANAVVATNNRAAFTAVVTGDNLVYQWYKNAGTKLTDDSHLTGSTTTAIVISPATTADIGNYYCIITNSCGVIAITTTNSLTLDAPNNLVWTGDAFNIDVWDVYAILAEWSGGSGFFNPGDNVTFDDTYPYANSVTLNGVLTPTSINVNATRDYLWGGAGTITGSNSLVKAGVGRLIVTNNAVNGYLNTYSGGTVISNGLVYVLSASALGTGPITLAGGGLETLGKLSFSNTVLVTANSLCQLDQSGNQSIAFLGPVIGNAGTTLVLTNSNTLTNSPNEVNFYGSFTNNSAIVLSVFRNATNATQRLGLFGSTNSQVYNGVISDLILTTDSGVTSGGGGVIKNGTGAAYLNVANTYTLGTSNLAGLLAGSGSINGPLAVFTNGIAGAGTATAIGTFTVNNAITFLGGNAFIRVNKSLAPAQSNDVISATGIITNAGTGTVTITNIGATPLVVGDSFKIFSGAVSNGAALTVTDGNISVWTNKLAIDGTVQVLSIVPNYSTNINYTVSGNILTITWPATHLGWILQSQTNALNVGLNTNNWVNVSGSASVTSIPITINPGNPSVFYRLSH